MVTSDELRSGLLRADRLIEWMSKYVGQMAPGDYAGCYTDLNEHELLMHRVRAQEVLKTSEPWNATR